MCEVCEDFKTILISRTAAFVMLYVHSPSFPDLLYLCVCLRMCMYDELIATELFRNKAAAQTE